MIVGEGSMPVSCLGIYNVWVTWNAFACSQKCDWELWNVHPPYLESCHWSTALCFLPRDKRLSVKVAAGKPNLNRSFITAQRQAYPFLSWHNYDSDHFQKLLWLQRKLEISLFQWLKEASPGRTMLLSMEGRIPLPLWLPVCISEVHIFLLTYIHTERQLIEHL